MSEFSKTTQTPTTETTQEKQKGSLLKQLWSFFAPTIICCALVVLVNTFFIFYATVPTGSMKNLIQENSFILANRLAYTNSDVQRGDVIVFEHESKYLVKRVIAIENDEVELRDGCVYLNGDKLDESAYVLGHTYAFGDRDHFTVPEGCVFVLGDNRDNSSDARVWIDPYLPQEAIRGRVFCSFSIQDWYFRGI